MEITINWFAILAAVLANLVIGAFWYSPLGLGKPWQRLVGISKSEFEKNNFVTILGALIFSFFIAYVLRHVIVLSENFYSYPPLQTGLNTGLAMWFGIALPQTFINYTFSRRPLGLIAIDAANQLATLLAMSIILALWV